MEEEAQPVGRPKKEEHAQRILRVSHLLAMGWPKWKIQKFLQDDYGYKRGGCNRIIKHARALLLKEHDMTREEAQCCSLRVYREIVGDEAMPIEVRMQAQTRIDKLLGLEEPQRVEQKVTGTQDNTVRVVYEGEDWKQAPRFSVEADQN